MMPSSRKGNRKTVLRRPVPISIGFARLLRNASEGKQADAPLFAKATRERWSKSDHSRFFARVVNTAEVAVDGDSHLVGQRDRGQFAWPALESNLGIS
jgi:hypothetical protein